MTTNERFKEAASRAAEYADKVRSVALTISIAAHQIQCALEGFAKQYEEDTRG